MSYEDYQNLKNIVQAHPEMKDKFDWSGKTLWEKLNPEQRKEYHRLDVATKCTSCGISIHGRLVLTKERLRLQDTEGFILFDQGPCCNKCVGEVG